MWKLALLAVLGLVASPAFAANCCRDDVPQAGHSHSTSSAHAVNSPDDIAHSDSHQAATPELAPCDRTSVRGDCEHAQCEAAPLIANIEPNKTFFASPLLALLIQTFQLQTPEASTAAIFLNRVARSRPPDRFSSSGLSPPSVSRS